MRSVYKIVRSVIVGAGVTVVSMIFIWCTSSREACAVPDDTAQFSECFNNCTADWEAKNLSFEPADLGKAMSACEKSCHQQPHLKMPEDNSNDPARRTPGGR